MDKYNEPINDSYEQSPEKVEEYQIRYIGHDHYPEMAHISIKNTRLVVEAPGNSYLVKGGKAQDGDMVARISAELAPEQAAGSGQIFWNSWKPQWIAWDPTLKVESSPGCWLILRKFPEDTETKAKQGYRIRYIGSTEFSTRARIEIGGDRLKEVDAPGGYYFLKLGQSQAGDMVAHLPGDLDVESWVPEWIFWDSGFGCVSPDGHWLVARKAPKADENDSSVGQTPDPTPHVDQKPEHPDFPVRATFIRKGVELTVEAPKGYYLVREGEMQPYDVYAYAGALSARTVAKDKGKPTWHLVSEKLLGMDIRWEDRIVARRLPENLDAPVSPKKETRSEIEEDQDRRALKYLAEAGPGLKPTPREIAICQTRYESPPPRTLTVFVDDMWGEEFEG